MSRCHFKRDVLGDNDTARRLLAAAEQVEGDCCRNADLVWACSEEDAHEFVERYGCAPDRVLVVPNGAAVDEVDYVPFSVRQAHQRRLERNAGSSPCSSPVGTSRT